MLTHFEIKEIGPMLRQMPQAGQQSFARCNVTIGIWDETKTAIDEITLNLAINHEDTDTLGTVKNRILAVATRVLQEAVRSVEGKDIQSVYEIAAAGDARWLQKYQAVQDR